MSHVKELFFDIHASKCISLSGGEKAKVRVLSSRLRETEIEMGSSLEKEDRKNQ
jgi:hypothetical protein